MGRGRNLQNGLRHFAREGHRQAEFVSIAHTRACVRACGLVAFRSMRERAHFSTRLPFPSALSTRAPFDSFTTKRDKAWSGVHAHWRTRKETDFKRFIFAARARGERHCRHVKLIMCHWETKIQLFTVEVIKS